MGAGDALGASGGQMTTRETPKAIFASKMGGPGLQMGAKIEAKMLLKIDQKTMPKRSDLGRRNVSKMEAKRHQNGGKNRAKPVEKHRALLCQ